MTPRWVRPLFVLAAIYDIGLGLGFMLGFQPIFHRFGVQLPNHDAYVQLPAALIVTFGLGFAMVARDPARHRDLITLGVLMKLAFAGVVLAHRCFGQIPGMWVPFAVCDALFMLAFLAALAVVPEPGVA